MKLTYKKGNGDKMHISVDGEYAFTVDENYFYFLGLHNKTKVEADELNEIANKIGERRAYNHAVSLLSRRDHTAKELKVKLKQKGYEQYCEAAVEKLVSGGYVNDERFAQLYVSELKNQKGFGKKRIEQELFKKGIDRDIIREVLDETDFSDNKLFELIEKKYLRYLCDEKGRQKTVNALIRLGYNYGEIRDAIKMLQENSEELFFEVTDE